jgi:Tfp pilus assembly protein PilO
MPKAHISTKRILIDKSQTTMVVATGIAAFVLVFSLIASKSLVGQMTYQNRVISAKKAAVSQLKDNISATTTLVNSYKAFVNTNQNVLGGNPAGTGAQDGDNAKIVLDALPSKYDFPALTTSLEKLITSQNLQIQSITGTDDEVAQSANATSATPKAVPMPFQIAVTGSYQGIQNLIKEFNSSIRPFQIKTIQLAGNQDHMTLTLTAQTFYQPEKDFNVTKKVIE